MVHPPVSPGPGRKVEIRARSAVDIVPGDAERRIQLRLNSLITPPRPARTSNGEERARAARKPPPVRPSGRLTQGPGFGQSNRRHSPSSGGKRGHISPPRCGFGRHTGSLALRRYPSTRSGDTPRSFGSWCASALHGVVAPQASAAGRAQSNRSTEGRSDLPGLSFTGFR